MSLDEQWDDPPAASLVGTVIAGRFRADAALATSDRSEVYEAVHLETGTPVVLKVLRTHPAREPVDQHLRDGRAIRTFAHPAIIDVVEAARLEDGTPFVVSLRADGPTLAALMRDRLPERRALTIVRQVLEALHVAHAAGVIHRDLRPEHVIVGRGAPGCDAVRVLGLGLAPLIRTAPTTFADPRYLAPEYVVGTAVDGRADLYAVGAMLFELLTGQPLFHAHTPEAHMRLHAYAPAPTLAHRVHGRTFLPELEALIASAVEKRREQRVRSAADMIAAIDAAIHAIDAEAAARTSIARARPRDEDNSLLLLARDALPPVAPLAPPPLVFDNASRHVRQLPLWMRLRKLAVAAVRRMRAFARARLAAQRAHD